MFQRTYCSEHNLYSLLFTQMKKLLVGAFLGMFTLAGVAFLPMPNYATAQDGYIDNSTSGDDRANPHDDMITWKAKSWSKLLTSAKKTVNWLLGILATIAVVICMYGWFLMVTSAWDEKKYQKWGTILKYAAIGLAVVWLSWLFVSLVYWFLNLQWEWNDMTEVSNG